MEQEEGVVTASTGNHGQSIASTAKLFGVRAVIVTPERANPLNVEARKVTVLKLFFTGRA